MVTKPGLGGGHGSNKGCLLRKECSGVCAAEECTSCLKGCSKCNKKKCAVSRKNIIEKAKWLVTADVEGLRHLRLSPGA